MQKQVEFKRVILGLQHNATSAELKIATEFAALLHLDVCGLFVKEQELTDFAALPFAREFNPLSGAWQAVDVAKISRQLDNAASSAERFLMEAVSQRGLSCQFQVVHGSITETIASQTRSSDIYVASEPKSALARAAASFRSMLDAALRSAAAVLFVPRHIDRYDGSIVAIATNSNDICIEIAAAIARAAKEDLVIVEDFAGDTGPQAGANVGGTGLNARRIHAQHLHDWDAREIASLFQPFHERMVVISGGAAAGDLAKSIATLRRVPVLIVEAPRDV